MKSFVVYLKVKGTIKKRIEAENEEEAQQKADQMHWRLAERHNTHDKNLTLHEDQSTPYGMIEIIS